MNCVIYVNGYAVAMAKINVYKELVKQHKERCLNVYKTECDSCTNKNDCMRILFKLDVNIIQSVGQEWDSTKENLLYME